MHAPLRGEGVVMPVSPEQAQMLATLALACRPSGARRWDAAGVMANIRKVADRELGTVILAVVQAAEDRGAETPGVIPTAGPHWRAPDPMRPVVREGFEPSATCASCGQVEAVCRQRWTDDHGFESVAQAQARKARGELDTGAAVRGLREAKATEPPPTADEARA